MPNEIPDYLSPEAATSRKPLLNDIDLYCLECGYNLRGLSGDPRRCPECGYWNPVGDIEIPTMYITAQLRRMETAPALCVATAMLAALFLFLVGLVVVQTITVGPDVAGLILCCGVPFIVSVIVWGWAVSMFRTSCMGNPNWVAALRVYHAYGLLLSVLIVAVILVGTGIVTGGWRGGANDDPGAAGVVIGLFAVAVAIAIIFVLGRRAHRRLRSIVEPMQRDVAVKIARQRLRRRMARAPRSGWFNR